jgi:hypothetical protein
VVNGGDLVRTGDPFPAILRLLIQGPWIGDNGERLGDSLADIKLINSQTKAQIQRIAETRLGALIRTGQITALQVLNVSTAGDRAFVHISVTVPGQAAPQTLQVPLT